EPKARAAATRVLCYWRDRVENPLELLQKQVNDEHPRVRLEAVRALSFFDGDQAAKAQEIVLESLVLPQDYYLEYTLNETTKTLDQRIKTQSKSK
ncbi:MAG: HEAT repeat domain-containing protein, partial [Isosphaeraceae bacterium]